MVKPVVVVIVNAAVFLLLGYALSRRIWNRTTDSMPLERLCSAGLLALAVWIGSLWIVALAHLLTREVLIERTILAALLALGLRLTERKRSPSSAPDAQAKEEHSDRWLIVVALAPVAAWTLFALWKGAVAPPLSHDALSYHLPKAVLFARAHGYEYLDQLHVIPRKLPSNYELMLAEVLVMTGSDRVTEWLSTLQYLLFVIAGTALVQRWWGRNPKRDAVVALLLAQIPVALLQSSAHKNDLMLAFFVIAALVWGARFVASGRTTPALLMVVSMALAVGTKPQAGFLGVAFLPFVIWRLWRDRNGRLVVVMMVASCVALALLGGASYAIDFAHELHGPGTSGNALTTFGFTDFANLWQAPYVLIAAPFSRDELSLSVPWESHPWFWRRYEIYFSDLGIGVALALAALPFAAVRLRREWTREAMAGSVVAFIAFVAMLPVVTIPHGLYTISLPRYALFIAPIALGWSVEAGLRSSDRLARIVLLSCSGLFVIYAVDNAVNDSFAPLRYVAWAADHPGTRLVPFSPNRAPCIADRLAGPYDKIAIDAGFSSWIYPAFGRDLTRPVQLLSGTGPLRVDADARWIVIDRGYEAAWNKPDFRDLSQVSRLPSRGSLSPESQAFLREALAVPGFRPIFVNATGGQAVLRRQ